MAFSIGKSLESFAYIQTGAIKRVISESKNLKLPNSGFSLKSHDRILPFLPFDDTLLIP